MSSEDVIELGSSEDEAEPAPKKMKPGPNAMVHIPGRHITAQTKPIKTPIPIIQRGKPITLTKLNTVVNPNQRKIKLPKPSQNLIIKPVSKQQVKKTVCIAPLNTSLNPVALLKKINNAQIMINKIPKHRNPIKIQNSKTLKNLPPSITITKTTAAPKRPAITNISNVRKKQKPNIKPNLKSTVGEVLTVDLDDDEVPEVSTAQAANPQWYLRPEQIEENTLEQENNKEPEASKMIEITIEDSPVKPIQTKKVGEVGTELSITIEDSPAKPPRAGNKSNDSESDHENTAAENVPQSKKKLEYPNEVAKVYDNSIEIEIEPMSAEHDLSSSIKDNEENDIEIPIVPDDISSYTKKTDTQQSTKPKKQYMNLESSNETVEGDSDIHPIYQNFIDLCFKLENSNDMKTIVEKKIKGYYKQVPKEYTESEEFLDMVSSKITSMKAGPEKMYLYIKDIVDELNLQRKLAKSKVLNEKDIESEKFLYGEDSEFDAKRQRQIRKLEKTLKKLHRAIQKLEEQEVDFDDDEDSVYLLTERYKERMVRVYAKFCQLTNTKMPSEPRVQIDARSGQPSGPAKRLEKWINKKVPIGTPLPFPDFHDVLRCVREANEEDKLGWNEVDIMEEARDLFTRCGKKLQRRRQENEWRLAASRISLDIDPAEDDDTLKKKLEDNRQLATKKETDVFNKYADRQSQLKLEAEEIEDKEAEESPVESEEEEIIDLSSALENKEKRKERLRRLIQEKSKKVKKVDDGDKPETDIGPTNATDVEEKELNVTQSAMDESEVNLKTVKVDSITSNENTVENQKNRIEADETHLVSDNSDRVDSDIDELHLLQKLHSANEHESSTLDSSDTDSPIDISDTLQSGSDNKMKQSSDVISIENSSYSESESNHATSNSKNIQTINKHSNNETQDETGRTTEKQSDQTVIQINNDECSDVIENILLASSDEEDVQNKEVCPKVDNIDSLDNGFKENSSIQIADSKEINANIELITDSLNVQSKSENLTVVEDCPSKDKIDKRNASVVETIEEENINKTNDDVQVEGDSPKIKDISSSKVNKLDRNVSDENIRLQSEIDESNDNKDNQCKNLNDDFISITDSIVLEIDSLIVQTSKREINTLGNNKTDTILTKKSDSTISESKDRCGVIDETSNIEETEVQKENNENSLHTLLKNDDTRSKNSDLVVECDNNKDEIFEEAKNKAKAINTSKISNSNDNDFNDNFDTSSNKNTEQKQSDNITSVLSELSEQVISVEPKDKEANENMSSDVGEINGKTPQLSKISEQVVSVEPKDKKANENVLNNVGEIISSSDNN